MLGQARMSIALIAAGFILNAATIASFPFVADEFKSDEYYGGMFFMAVVSLIFGGIVFQWWGIAYGVGTFIVYLLTAAYRESLSDESKSAS